MGGPSSPSPGEPAVFPAKSFPVRLDTELRAALEERAENDGRTASEIVREVLRQFLDAS